MDNTTMIEFRTNRQLCRVEASDLLVVRRGSTDDLLLDQPFQVNFAGPNIPRYRYNNGVIPPAGWPGTQS